MVAGGGRYFVQISGDVYLGTGGFDQWNQGADTVKNGFDSIYSSNPWEYANVRITYQFGSPNNQLYAPGGIQAYTAYDVTATPHDPEFVGPLTWTWYLNDEYMGTSSEPQFTFYANTPWASEHVRAVANDNYGHSRAGETYVQISGTCPPPEIICD